MVYCYWTFVLLFDKKHCYSLLMDELMLLYTMDVLKSDGTTSVMLLLLHAVDHLTKTLMTLQMTIVEQYSYCHFHYWDPLLGHQQDKHPLHQWVQ